MTDPKFWNALQSINGDKALGPDGYMLTFFLDLDNWDVLRADFVEGVQYCFENGYLPNSYFGA